MVSIRKELLAKWLENFKTKSAETICIELLISKRKWCIIFIYRSLKYDKKVSFHRPLNFHGFTVCHTVSLPFSQPHGRFFISHGSKNFERIFSQTHSFLKKQTQAAHSNVNKEHISSMINKNKTSIRSSLYLSWVLLFIMLVKTHTGVPFQ